MQITGITPDQFSEIVHKVGERDYEGNLHVEFGSRQSDTRFRARVVPNRATVAPKVLAPGARRSLNMVPFGGHERSLKASCWHVFRDVFTELFDQYPEAKIYTGMAKYRGRDEFYRNYPGTAHVNIGSMMYPMTMPETCDCNG